MDQFFDLDSSLGFLCMSANRLMGSRFRKQLVEAGLDLTAEQWGVLAFLWNRGGLSQEELASYTCVDKSSMSRVLDGLERKGLVRRERDPANARRKILYASPQAEPFKEQCRHVAITSMQEMLHNVSDDDLRVCLKVLSQVKENIQERSSSTP